MNHEKALREALENLIQAIKLGIDLATAVKHAQEVIRKSKTI
jgi:hypothetical protein